jgi:hypothetical protein
LPKIISSVYFANVIFMALNRMKICMNISALVLAMPLEGAASHKALLAGWMFSRSQSAGLMRRTKHYAHGLLAGR